MLLSAPNALYLNNIYTLKVKVLLAFCFQLHMQMWEFLNGTSFVCVRFDEVVGMGVQRHKKA